jgi:hypothetical protein
MKGFKDFIEAFKQYERQLFSLVLSSFFLSSLLTIIEHQQFSSDFMVLSSIVGGIMGVAGILSSYHGSLRNVRDKLDYLLRFEPQLPRLSLPIAFAVVAMLLGAFYYLAVNGNPFCLMFLAVAQFLFFKALAGSLLGQEILSRQEDTWKAMSPEERATWDARQEKQRVFLEKLKEMASESEMRVDQWTADVKRTRKNTKRTLRRIYIWDRLHNLSLRLRVAIAGNHLLTRWERLDQHMIEEEAQNLIDKYYQDDIESIIAGKVPAIPLENTKHSIYKEHGRVYVVFDAPTITSAEALKIIEELSPLKEISNEKYELIAVVQPNTQITFEAGKYFSDYGIKIMRPRAKGIAMAEG